MEQTACTMNRRNLTQIPQELEYLPPDHLIHLLRIVAAERDDLFQQLQREHAKTAALFQNDVYGFPHPEPATAALAVPEEIDRAPSTFRVDAAKKRIAKKSYNLVKKTAHNKTKKPYSEISEAVPTVAKVYSLFEGYGVKVETSRLIKWQLTGGQVVEWLGGANKYIHPVRFDGKVIAFGTSKPFIYAWASYDGLQAKYDKKGGSLTLRFRTKMVGSGRPTETSKDSPPCLA